jgi:nucleoside-diphosphate-sugar epimerase
VTAVRQAAGGGTGPHGLRGLRVLVLGGSGFLGGRAARSLALAGADVTSVSRGGGPPLGPGGPQVTALRLDLAAMGPRMLRDFLAARAPAVVVNAVGQVWGGEGGMADLNDRLVADLVATLPARTRLVQLGSSLEYGPVTGTAPVHETRRPAPDTVYARTKLRGTEHVLRASRDGRLDGAVLRVANVSGPGAPGLLGSVARWIAERSAEQPPPGGHVLRLGPLLAARDFVDVRDVGDAVVRAVAARPGRIRGRVVNIGGGRAVPVDRLVDRLLELSGLPVRREAAGGANGSPRSSAAWQQLDIDRARRLLGWVPRHALDQSLRDMLAAPDPARGHDGVTGPQNPYRLEESK